MDPVSGEEATGEEATNELVDASLRGDRRAQLALYLRFVTRVHFVVTRMVGRNEADDVTQNVFLQVFRRLEQYRQESRFETWLYRLTVNEALQYRRRNRQWPFPTLNEDVATKPDNSRAMSEERELLDRALAEVPDDLRIVFVLREVEGMNYRDLADVLEIPTGTVASKLSRARQELRRKLIELGWEQ